MGPAAVTLGAIILGLRGNVLRLAIIQVSAYKFRLSIYFILTLGTVYCVYICTVESQYAGILETFEFC